MHIFLIRHGESVANINENHERIVDHLVPLTERGKEQAKSAGEWLAGYCRDNDIDTSRARIWRSPFIRTRQTSGFFNLSLGITDVREDITLTEQQYGLFDGLTVPERERLYPNECEEYRRQLNSVGKLYARCPMGESPFDVAIRIQQFIDQIRRDFERDGTDTLFVFTHGAALRAFLLRWFYYTPEWFHAEPNPANCAIREIIDDRDLGFINV